MEGLSVIDGGFTYISFNVVSFYIKLCLTFI